MILIILWLSSRRRLWSRINSKFFFQTLPIKPFAVPIRYLPKGFRRNEISSSITQKTALRYIIVTDLTLEEDTSKKEGGLLWNTSSRRFFIGGIFHGFLAGVDGLFDLSYIQHLRKGGTHSTRLIFAEQWTKGIGIASSRRVLTLSVIDFLIPIRVSDVTWDESHTPAGLGGWCFVIFWWFSKVSKHVCNHHDVLPRRRSKKAKLIVDLAQVCTCWARFQRWIP